MGNCRNKDNTYIEGGNDNHRTEFWYHIIMKMSISQEWMGNKLGPTNFKHGCESKIDIDLEIEPSGDNGIVSENNRSVTINTGGIPSE